MGFATDDQVEAFLKATPTFEKMLVDDGILLFKYWLTCDQEEQERALRGADRRPAEALETCRRSIRRARAKYAEYTKAREAMLKATHTAHAPWTLVDFNDQRVGRLTLIRDLLDRLPDISVRGAEARLAAAQRRSGEGALHGAEADPELSRPEGRQGLG